MSLKPLARIGALLIALGALGAVGAELALRRMGYGRRVVTVLDERLGWKRLPGQRLVTRSGVELAINSLGYRDREWGPPGDERAEEQLLRVAVLGGSIAAGSGVELEACWVRRLERRLREAVSGDPRWTDAVVMNFSGPAYGVEQMVRVYEDQVRPYRPDLVIASVAVTSVRPLRPGRPAGGFPFDQRIRATALYDWFQREVAREHGVGGFADEEELEPELRRRIERSDLAVELLRDRPFSEEARPLWEEAQARMAAVARDLAARGGRLYVLSMPRLGELDPAKPARAAIRWRVWAAGQPGARCVDPRLALREAMAGLIAEVRARGLPAARVWRREDRAAPRPLLEHEAESVFFLDDSEHLSARGHAALAEFLYGELAPALAASG